MNISQKPLLPIKQSMLSLSKFFNNSISFQLFSICFLVFFQFFISGCAARQVMLDRAVVFNDTAGIISEVKVRHEPTGKIGAVNMILPQRSLDLGFPRQPMLAKEAVITWRDHQGMSRRVKVALPGRSDGIGGEQSNSLVYFILPNSINHPQIQDLEDHYLWLKSYQLHRFQRQ